MLMRKLAVFVVVFIFVRLPLADAAFDLLKFERLVVFGDSLSDTGNALSLDPSFFMPPTPLPPAPYLNGRFSNGPVWVDYFALSVTHFAPVTAFFITNQPSEHGINFAVGGSTSGDVNVLPAPVPIPSFPAQIGAYVASLGGKSAANDLCVIWIGANDFGAGIAAGSLNPRATVENIRDGIAQLSSAGAKTFIVINIPDIALTPQVKATPTIIQAARQFVFTVNALLEVELLPFAWLHRISVEIVDINRIFIPLVLNPGRFGFTNSSGFALDPRTGGGDTNPDDYVFWDGFHPTTKAHQIAAEFIYKEIVSRRVFADILPLARRTFEAVSP